MKRNTVVDILVFILIVGFLFSFLTPKYVFSKTTATGGDMGSHYPTAVYMKNVLLPAGKVMGWEQGNYAGFPMFYHYFPLTYIITALISFVVPMQIAFKVGTILGTLLLPVGAYLALRAMRYKFPIPIFGAMFPLAFLFNEGNSMWGGNILSTLAGEYSYSFSMAFLILFTGTLYAGITERKWVILNAVLVFIIGFSHGFTLVFGCMIAAFFLITRRDFWANFVYLFKVFGLGGLLMSFWFVPFYFNLPYVTKFAPTWYAASWREYAPVVLWPFTVIAAAALLLNLFDRRTLYFAYILGMSVAMYFIGALLGTIAIRFVPFTQLYATIFAATILLVFLGKIRLKVVLPFIAFLGVALWVQPKAPQVKNWVKWNYEGLESKGSWATLKEIHEFLRTSGPGRIVYEHTPDNNVFGTPRVFENLSFFTGRGTLEGLYLQSSLTAPFVFYIQSQIGKYCSAPFYQYAVSRLDLRAAMPRLNLFNVTHFIVRTPEAKAQARTIPDLKLEKSVGQYEIYRVTSSDGHYVVPAQYEPVVFQTRDWKNDFYGAFANPSLLDVPIVYLKDQDGAGSERFKLRTDSFLDLPHVPLAVNAPDIEETIGNEDIEFTTNLIGHPHLIRISYHPNWKVEGADRIYQVSPTFMLVYPTQSHVRMHFGKNVFNYAGELMTLAGLATIVMMVRRRPRTPALQNDSSAPGRGDSEATPAPASEILSQLQAGGTVIHARKR